MAKTPLYDDPSIPGPSNGDVRGVDSNMPDRGTTSGTVGMGSPYGADIGVNATNRISGIGRSTQSDPMDQCYPQGGGDFTAGSTHQSVSGRSMGSAAKSDDAYDNVPDDPLHPDADDR